MNRNDTMSPTEYADLVRDARALVAAVERGVRRTGAVFVATMGLTVAGTALGLDLVASLAAVVAVTAFTAALVLLMARIALGPAPAEVAPPPPPASSSTRRTVARGPLPVAAPLPPERRDSAEVAG
ncbi:hypothetical protein [Promicromonospora panici]|uniref:hypothetical protein n=1 Tax=Promicromonospora panici TaxID=2219658 RepID=UPI00101D417E|nr:hypothetical protein [Promicromonospora panici]